MVRVLVKSGLVFASLLLFCGPSQSFPQDPVPASLNTSGSIVIDGHPTPYLIRRLPISSFPDLPPAVQEQLDHRGCLIPQTYEARQPENVVHASLEHPGSSDWAVLCSAQGTVSLLVFFGGRRASRSRSPRRLKPSASNRTDHRKFSASIGPSIPHRLRTFTKRNSACAIRRRASTTTPSPTRSLIATPSTTIF